MHWDIWREGYSIPGGQEEATKLNSEWVEAETFNEAVSKFAASRPDKEQFKWSKNGWTYSGSLIYDNETAARIRFG